MRLPRRMIIGVRPRRRLGQAAVDPIIVVPADAPERLLLALAAVPFPLLLISAFAKPAAAYIFALEARVSLQWPCCPMI